MVCSNKGMDLDEENSRVTAFFITSNNNLSLALIHTLGLV